MREWSYGEAILNFAVVDRERHSSLRLQVPPPAITISLFYQLKTPFKSIMIELFVRPLDNRQVVWFEYKGPFDNK